MILHISRLAEKKNVKGDRPTAMVIFQEVMKAKSMQK